jgi:hypothetical protein
MKYFIVLGILPIPPRESGTHDLLIEVPTVRQNDLGHGPLVSVDVANFNRDSLPERQITRELRGPSPEGLLRFWAIYSPKTDPLRGAIVHDFDRVPIRNGGLPSQ